LDTLTLREREILKLRYGLDGKGIRTLGAVAREFCSTSGRIMQLEAKAIRKLQHPLRATRLEGFLGDGHPAKQIRDEGWGGRRE